MEKVKNEEKEPHCTIVSLGLLPTVNPSRLPAHAVVFQLQGRGNRSEFPQLGNFPVPESKTVPAIISLACVQCREVVHAHGRTYGQDLDIPNKDIHVLFDV